MSYDRSTKVSGNIQRVKLRSVTDYKDVTEKMGGDRRTASRQEQDINQLLKVRREKLAELQEAGKDPFVITKYDVDTSQPGDQRSIMKSWKERRFPSQDV